MDCREVCDRHNEAGFFAGYPCGFRSATNLGVDQGNTIVWMLLLLLSRRRMETFKMDDYKW